MILAIDVGNSNIVLGALEKGKILFVSRIMTNKNKTSDEYAIELKEILELNETPSGFEGAVISCVVPELVKTLALAVKKVAGVDALTVGPGVKTGLNIAIDNPAQLGSDLVVGAVAAINKYPAPTVIIDMGTATTVTVIDKNKALIGGMIMPGVRLSLRALTERTALLPNISLEAPKSAIGKNTIDCMKSGVVIGASAMLDGIIDRLEKELGYSATVVATGGIAEFIVPNCTHKITVDNDLLLDGLYVIYEKNK